MPVAVIDACCLIDVLASGQAEAILRAAGFSWRIPQEVRSEVRYVRQHDPANPGQTITAPVDLTPLIAAGLLNDCRPENQQELDRFTQYAALFRSDGEAACLALAESRGWIVATDDQKAIKIAGQAGLTVVSCPQLVKSWADAPRPADADLAALLCDIQTLAQFRPNPSMPEFQWWVDLVAHFAP